MDSEISAVKPAPVQPPTVGALFFGFFCLGMTAFGGVLPLVRHMVVERHRWLTAQEFTDLLGLCQFLPGGNVINLAVAIGMKFRGPMGAFAAMLGLIAVPTVVVIGLGIVYNRYQHDAYVQHVFAGLAAAAAGLLVAMAGKMAWPMRKNLAGIVIALACILAVAVWRLPLALVMLVLTPLSIFFTYRRRP